jgi:transposase
MLKSTFSIRWEYDTNGCNTKLSEGLVFERPKWLFRPYGASHRHFCGTPDTNALLTKQPFCGTVGSKTYPTIGDAAVSELIIERVDEIPLLLHWLLRMNVAEIIDRILPLPHRNRQGLSYGQLVVLFITYVIYLRNHRLCVMEEWVQKHLNVLREITQWPIQVKDATDDRLGDMLSILGADEEQGVQLQQELGRHHIQAFRMPTKVARYDTTTCNVYHEMNGQTGNILNYGHSKDHRPDLLQFKIGLGTLDPAGVPLCVDTLPGNAADDPQYVPAWRRMKAMIGHSQFLYVADCKAAAWASRAQIDAEEGYYLFPLPMTGQVPELLRSWVLQPPVAPEPIVLTNERQPEQAPVVVGVGFVVELGGYARLEDGKTRHHWMESWLVTRSDSLAKRRQETLERHLHKAESQLQNLNCKNYPSLAETEAAVQQIMERQQVVGLLQVSVSETVTEQTRYVGRGRPGPNRQQETVSVHQMNVSVQRNQAAIDEAKQLAGWRIHVTNDSSETMSLSQAIRYYRDEFLVEHGMHRFKRGSLPVLPLFLKIPERIRGLILILMIALQLLTLMEFTAQRELAERGETISGLVPGNPKMKTARPSAERLLARFNGLNWLAEPGAGGRLVEELSLVQKRILDILGVPTRVYALGVEV